MFIGRDRELDALEQFTALKSSKAGIIYGKRRIGKTTLLREFSKKTNIVVIAYECGKISLEKNIELFSEAVSESIGIDVSKNDFKAIFSILALTDKEILVILDEYQFMKRKNDDYEMDSILKGVIDSLSDNVKIIITGSSISVMKDIMRYENPLYGRFDLVINLKEFDYYEASSFYKDLETKDKIAFYSIFGGSPYVLTYIDSKKTLKENIETLILPETGIIRTYLEYIITSEIEGMPYLYSILEAIGNSKLRYSEIEDRIGIKSTGTLSRYLEMLLKMDILKNIVPINKKNDKKKQFYAISDNILRFYFTFIYKRKGSIELIGIENFYKRYINESLNTFISYRFENIVLQYFSRLAKSGKLDADDIGRYWIDDKKNKTTFELDCVIKYSSNQYASYEVKYYQKPMSKDDITLEIEKMKNITELNLIRIGLVSSSGFEERPSHDIDYISGEELYI